MARAQRRRYAPRVPPEERRRQVLDAALGLIAEHGYSGVSMEAIAREVGVAKPVVYDLYPNLGKLLAELLDREEQRAFEQLAAAIPTEPGADPRTALTEGFVAFITAVTENPEAWRLIVMPPEATPQVVREHVERGRAQVVKQLEGLVAWGVEQIGGPLGEVDVELAAQAIVALGEHSGRLALTDPDRYPPERFGRMAATLIASVRRAGRSAR